MQTKEARIEMSRTINGRTYRSRVWPNQIGEDIEVPSGTIEILHPVDLVGTFRARFVPEGEKQATMYGEAAQPVEAVESMEPFEN